MENTHPVEIGQTYVLFKPANKTYQLWNGKKFESKYYNN